VLAEALERKREEQSAFLDCACSADPLLRAQVEMLLSSGDRSSVLQSAALQMRLKPGTKLGEYGVGGKSIKRMTDGWAERWQSRYCPRPCLGNVERLHRLNQEARTAAALNQTTNPEFATGDAPQKSPTDCQRRHHRAPRALRACPAFGETRSTGGPHVIVRVPGRLDMPQLAGRGKQPFPQGLGKRGLCR
jgi:hypothetical protein